MNKLIDRAKIEALLKFPVKMVDDVNGGWGGPPSDGNKKSRDVFIEGWTLGIYQLISDLTNADDRGFETACYLKEHYVNIEAKD